MRFSVRLNFVIKLPVFELQFDMEQAAGVMVVVVLFWDKFMLSNGR